MTYRYMADGPRETRPGDILMVVHDFNARSTDELTLRKGDRIALVELDDGFGDGWYLGKHLGRGGTGLFPGVYTAKLPAGPPALRNSISNNRPSLPSEPQVFSLPPDQHVYNAGLPSPPPALDTLPQPSLQSSLNDSYQNEPRIPAKVTSASQVQRSNSVTPPQPSPIQGIQRSISETLGQSAAGEDSPVMNETLSVIDEHITDLSTPRHSFIGKARRPSNDSASDYSGHLADHRQSYLAGPETDDEESGKLREKEVKQWNHKQTADHLRHLGVDARHCDIFEEQEITGDVLLEMDQDFLFMKEYDFGVMGRRLKTWHKVRAFQEEVKGPFTRRKSVSNVSGQEESLEELERPQTRVGSMGPILPRIPSLIEKPGLNYRQSRQNTVSSQSDVYSGDGVLPPLQPLALVSSLTRTNTASSSSPWRASLGPESPRPSAASVREITHSRRHSLLETVPPPQKETPVGHHGQPTTSHSKKPSLDREWSLSTAGPSMNSAMDSTSRLSTITQERVNAVSSPLFPVRPSSPDLDRGYFSGGEIETRKSRTVLRKRESAGASGHSRHSSFVEEQKRNAAAIKRQSKIGSTDSMRDMVPQVISPASKAYHSNTFKGRMRSSSAQVPTRTPSNGAMSPTVTNLEDRDAAFSLPLSKGAGRNGEKSSTLTQQQTKLSMPNHARRVIGLRAISDAVTGEEKALVMSPSAMPSPVKENPTYSPARTGSSTPSITSRSIEIDNTDTSSKGTEGPASLLTPQLAPRSKPKSKKDTSAYIRGLEKKTPAEQRLGCDYSGWMKKKSSSLMTTWKPRLFILKGRRLSYYYSEDDPQERGVIDISSHKVLVANQDSITTLHATITGAASSATPPSSTQASTPTSELAPVTPRVKTNMSEPPFYFKLVPPKAGLSRAVQFTKPTIHYFQVDNIIEGRKWMGEMMKATIERDPTLGFETTNKQKTISLAKARARKERPPALKGTEVPSEKSIDDTESNETGLNIQGLNFDDDKGDVDSKGSASGQAGSLEAPISESLVKSASDSALPITELAAHSTS